MRPAILLHRFGKWFVPDLLDQRGGVVEVEVYEFHNFYSFQRSDVYVDEHSARMGRVGTVVNRF